MREREEPKRLRLPSPGQKSLDTACERVGIPRIAHHDLRHLFATTCIKSGIDIPTVSRWLGHKDGGALAMKVYGHLRDHHSKAMAQKVTFGHVNGRIERRDVSSVVQQSVNGVDHHEGEVPALSGGNACAEFSRGDAMPPEVPKEEAVRLRVIPAGVGDRLEAAPESPPGELPVHHEDPVPVAAATHPWATTGNPEGQVGSSPALEALARASQDAHFTPAQQPVHDGRGSGEVDCQQPSPGLPSGNRGVHWRGVRAEAPCRVLECLSDGWLVDPAIDHGVEASARGCAVRPAGAAPVASARPRAA